MAVILSGGHAFRGGPPAVLAATHCIRGGLFLLWAIFMRSAGRMLQPQRVWPESANPETNTNRERSLRSVGRKEGRHASRVGLSSIENRQEP